MKTINRLKDLEVYGIYPLTGEADALGYRILCDVDKRGKQLIEDTFGVQCGTDPWNDITDGREHVACVMLTHRACQDIGPIALLTDCHTVLRTEDGTLIGFEGDEEFRTTDDGVGEYRISREWLTWSGCYGKPERTFGNGPGPSVGTRNVHQASGRTA